MATLKGLTQWVKSNIPNPDIIFDPNKPVDWISTGCLMFDTVTGGGLPRGRITEIFGMEHSGKSAIAWATHSVVRSFGGTSLHVDFEHATDPKHIKITYNLTIDGEKFQVFQPMSIEEGGDIIDALIQNEIHLDFISFDSVDAMKPKALIEGSLSDEARVGAQAKAIGRFVTKMRQFAQQTNAAVLFINQMRVNINTSKFEQNVGTAAGYNPMESHTTPGGYALRFYASLRVKLEYGGKIELEKGENRITSESGKEKQRIGQTVKVINVKNKVSLPFLKGLANFYFPIPGMQRGGWSQFHDMLDMLTPRGHMRQGGAKFTYNGLNIPEWSENGGKTKAHKLFMSNPELMADARALIKKLIAEENSFDSLMEEYTEGAQKRVTLLETLSEEEKAAEEQEDKRAAMILGTDKELTLSLGSPEGDSTQEVTQEATEETPQDNPGAFAAPVKTNPFAKKATTEVSM